MRVLVDTCVIIDALQSRAPFSEVAQKLFIYSANKQFEGYITAKSVTDIYYLTHRLTHNDVEARKIFEQAFYFISFVGYHFFRLPESNIF